MKKEKSEGPRLFKVDPPTMPFNLHPARLAALEQHGKQINSTLPPAEAAIAFGGVQEFPGPKLP